VRPKTEEGVVGDKEISSVLPLKEVIVETEKYAVTLSNEGGCIKSIVLKEYPHPSTNEIFTIVDILKPEEGIFNMQGLGITTLPKTRFGTIEKENEVIFSTQLSNGIEILKRYIFHKDLYHIELEVYISNPTNILSQTNYAIVAASNIEIGTRLDRNYTHIVSEIKGKPHRSRGGKKGTFVSGTVNYTGLQNRYFSVIAKPTAPTKGAALWATQDNNLMSVIEIENFRIPSNSKISHTYLLFVGPSNKDLLASYGLSSALSYGMWGGISKILLAGLKLFHRIFRNWGVAVILLAACVNFLLFPIMRKSYESMKKMQELQPHIERLKNEHKDNPHKLNKEMIELYKKYNINPMGGCLPLFLQIPIIIAFWQALMRSIELRGANFLWIKDLSSADSVPLPIHLPVLGDTINILPLLMTAAMVLQQKLATKKGTTVSAQQRQQQQMMLIMFPAMFLIFMYNAPAGLVLYWLTNTLLTMFEQRAIMHTQ
jgi:YidC/Oxa1 family membrane protein insertase